MTRVSEERFEALYRRDPDPWGYGDSPYELAKYERTLAACPPRVGHALELGCSIGVFTSMLAPRCEELTGIDFSSTAVAEARRRNAAHSQVRILRGTLPEQMPEGRFDLVVCSEVLYYWDRELVLAAIAGIEERVADGGRLVVAGWRGNDARAPLDAAAVRALVEEATSLAHVLSEDHPGYLLDAWERR